MSIITTEAENKTKYKKTPTSMFLDKTLWYQVRKTAFEQGITATEFVEEALKQKLVEVGKKDG
jgi:hypothetical protein